MHVDRKHSQPPDIPLRPAAHERSLELFMYLALVDIRIRTMIALKSEDLAYLSKSHSL